MSSNFYSFSILQVNGQSLLGATHTEAVRALRSVADKMCIMVCDGFDASLLESNSPRGSVIEGQVRSSSESSVDAREDDIVAIRKQVS